MILSKLQNKFKNNNLDYDLFLEEVEIQTNGKILFIFFIKKK